MWATGWCLVLCIFCSELHFTRIFILGHGTVRLTHAVTFLTHAVTFLIHDVTRLPDSWSHAVIFVTHVIFLTCVSLLARAYFGGC